ncbi:MAG TPA: DUF3016 domain-containing protein [Tahibacter sp.]|nr:DUF3016 domain-containing protein [Tahibacter sp.]
MKLRIALAFAAACSAALVAPAWAASRNVTDADAPRSLPAKGPVSVRWEDPAQFSEIRYSRNRFEARRGDWVNELAAYLRTRAQSRVPAGGTLDVDITDIKRAGDYEPWRGAQLDDTRVIRDLYPPRIDLTFKLTDASGRVVAEGERRLRNLSFMMDARMLNDSDPLRYEKALIDRWLRKELRAPDDGDA